MQLEQFQSPAEIFGDYAYFSSYSESWLAHARAYAEMAVSRFDLDGDSQVVEVASNDGYLLQYFQRAGVPVLGMEPAANVAAVATSRGIPRDGALFRRGDGARAGRGGPPADLLIGNNVLAHVPDINDFVGGLAIALKPEGSHHGIPSSAPADEEHPFDTIYHEHFSYLSFLAVERIFAAHGLELFDVEELSTHGGSLRIYARHKGASGPVAHAVAEMRARERAAGLDDVATYRGFAERVKAVKRGLLSFLIEAKFSGKPIAAYGAAAKGNTLLNYCGIRGDLSTTWSTCRRTSRAPICRAPISRSATRPCRRDPARLSADPARGTSRTEIMAQMAHIRGWGGKFVVPIPELAVLD